MSADNIRSLVEERALAGRNLGAIRLSILGKMKATSLVRDGDLYASPLFRSRHGGTVQPECEHNEDRPANNGDRRLDCADKAECPRQQRNRNQVHAVHEDLPRCGALSGNDRQHGDAGTGIFVATIERQGQKWAASRGRQ
jgi:hypothetical protein